MGKPIKGEAAWMQTFEVFLEATIGQPCEEM